jgi:hypothetical protein
VDLPEQSRRLGGKAQPIQQDLGAAQIELTGLRRSGVELLASLREPLAQGFEAPGPLQELVEALPHVLRSTGDFLQLREDGNRRLGIVEAVREDHSQGMEALDALLGRGELRQMPAHLDRLPQPFTLLEERQQGVEAGDVVRVCLEGALVGVDRRFHVAIGGVRIRQATAVRRLFLALEQHVQTLEGLAQLARVVQGLLEPRAGLEGGPVLGHHGHETLDP